MHNLLLNDFSRRVADRLFAKCPEWVQFVQPDEDNEGSLILEIPSTVPGADPLLFLTENDEITVGTTSWHDHYGSWTGASEDEAASEAFRFLDEFIAERLVIVRLFREGREGRSWTSAPGRELSDYELKPGEEARVESWRGTFNSTIVAK